MTRSNEVRKVAFIGDYLPRKCGIATFTHDLRTAVAERYPAADCLVVPVNDLPEGYDYPPEVRFEIAEKDLDSYLHAADFLNFSTADVVCLQHEFGIYGGPAGSHILGLLRDLRLPVVTTLHTILREPNPEQRRVLTQLIALSARLVVMTERARRYLLDIYDAPADRVDLIAHGIPDTPFVDPDRFKEQFGVEGKFVLLTFGLLSAGKGIEHVLQALPAVLRRFPDTVYLVLGATHPNLVREQGESYRISLEQLARRLGVHRNVIFYNRFVELTELTEFLNAADVYVTPYLNPNQITSGTLAYAFGCGKAVVSTPYWHAEELLADGKGVLVPFANPDALAVALIDLLADEPRRLALRKHAYLLGRDMVWGQVAHRYMDSFRRARRGRADQAARPLAIRTLEQRQGELPDWRLDHLHRLTDSTGLFQHAAYTLPRYGDGYCTDDNARALLLTVFLDELGEDDPDLPRLASTCAAFVDAAFVPGLKRFRNFLGFDRRWLEDSGSDDCCGRAVWALGTCVGRSPRRAVQHWAVGLFQQALPGLLDTSSPRGWAFALLGIQEYLARLSGDRHVGQVRDTLLARLLELYDRAAGPDWPWCEDSLAYDNARLPQALIAAAAAAAAGAGPARDRGLHSLRWLVDRQKAPAGHFRPIGSNGFWTRGREPARFDQQPVEACATVSACLTAYHATGEDSWLREAYLAFDWFLGRNDLGLEIYDPATGGCHDGLHEDRVNQNEGAESTLAFLLALAELKLVKHALAAFPPPPGGDPGPTGPPQPRSPR